MIQSHIKTSTVISGAMGVIDSKTPKMKILHKAASSLNIEGFKVKRITVFENPLTANVELENKLQREGLLAKFVTSANEAFKHINQNFLVSLTLTDFTCSDFGVEMSYTIKRVQKNNTQTHDETSIAIAKKMHAKLVSAVEKPGASLFTTIPAA